jgi:hypothetical protein
MRNKTLHIKIALIASLIFFAAVLMGEDMTSIALLKDHLTEYEGKEITMVLRLKLHDRVFEKLVFYDERNLDIEFDITRRKISHRLRKDLLNLHEGLKYRVTFKVTGKGDTGMVTGILIRAVPGLIEKIPE